MIGRLTGEVSYIDSDYLIVDVNGVGYLVYCTTELLSRFSTGKAAQFWIEMEVKQEQILLFGFTSIEEKRWFRILQSVQGVGAKVALSILSAYEPLVLVSAIAQGDKAAFQRISGVGPKLATRLVTELQSKTGTLASSSVAGSGRQVQVTGPQAMFNDAVSALVNLGFNRVDVQMVVNGILAQNDNELELSELIKKGIIALGNGT